MTALVITNIEKQLKRTHIISERDAHILLAYLKAQETRIAELKKELEVAKAKPPEVNDVPNLSNHDR